MPYLPSFFFGSLLMLFGIEISLSWLVLSYKKARLLPNRVPTLCDTAILDWVATLHLILIVRHNNLHRMRMETVPHS